MTSRNRMSLVAGALAAFDHPSAHNQIRAIYVRKLETLSGDAPRCCSGNATTALVFRTSTDSATLANVETMHESGQIDPSGPEDKRQS
ncbi:unnamed protein product [Pieris macdunnoughi]|uniref:Uncharacterized protein n=1 Tax=Pieris macdunnoughi TaxID=345717 RepID=A0A821MRE4_9NEOP|nr:unnamed protein product [Pieris macdunnoughi]